MFRLFAARTTLISVIVAGKEKNDVQEIIAYLHTERTRLDQAITALEGVTPRRGRPPRDSRGSKRRVMSTAARKRISAAMKARWAARKKRVSSTKTAKKLRKRLLVAQR